MRLIFFTSGKPGAIAALCLFILHCSSCISIRAATTNIGPVADTTLSENWPTNNMGKLIFANSGTTQNFTKNRALFQFDIAASIPAHSRITGAKLILEVVKEPADGFNPADFGIHRLLVPWGEGSQSNHVGGREGEGTLAVTNEATWFSRFAFTTNTWTIPGGAFTNDFVATASASQTVYGRADSPYSWSSTTQTVADVQLWLDNPSTNFGWALVCQSEQTDFTARRFASREDPYFGPQLKIDFIPPPQILSASRASNQFNLTFNSDTGAVYFVEYRNSILTNQNWNLLTNIGTLPAATNILILDSLTNDQRFYRVGFH